MIAIFPLLLSIFLSAVVAVPEDQPDIPLPALHVPLVVFGEQYVKDQIVELKAAADYLSLRRVPDNHEMFTTTWVREGGFQPRTKRLFLNGNQVQKCIRFNF